MHINLMIKLLFAYLRSKDYKVISSILTVQHDSFCKMIGVVVVPNHIKTPVNKTNCLCPNNNKVRMHWLEMQGLYIYIYIYGIFYDLMLKNHMIIKH